MFSARAIHQMAGGVERMVIRIMNAMVERGHQVELLTWDLAGAQAFYPMSTQIRWHCLNLGHPEKKPGKEMLLKRARRIRQIVRDRRPQMILCFQDGPFMALRLYTMGLGVPVAVAERNAPTRFDHTRNGGRRQAVTFTMFRLAARIFIQLETYRSFYPEYLHQKMASIPNPVALASQVAKPAKPICGRFCLLSVGRLGYQKNYTVLVRAFAVLADCYPQWDMVIAGEGEERSRLEGLIQDLGLGKRISLPGTVKDTATLYTNAHLFCLSSRWEGFPNALAEAFSHGLPAAGFADCAGVNELISDGVSGYLAAGNNDLKSLCSVLEPLMSLPHKRQEMGEAGKKAVTHFRPDTIMNCWETSFKTLIKP
jgi:glycosyltransferase involved in cell wall biosynthesis